MAAIRGFFEDEAGADPDDPGPRCETSTTGVDGPLKTSLLLTSGDSWRIDSAGLVEGLSDS